MTALVLPNTLVNGTIADADEVMEDFAAIADYVNAGVIRKDGTVAMAAPLTLLGDPTTANHAVRKAYLDGSYVLAQSGVNQTYSAGVWQTLKFATQVTDRRGEYNQGTGVFTALTGGVYSVTFTIEPDQSYNSLIRMRIVAGSNTFWGPLYQPSEINKINEAARQQCHADVLILAGQTIEPQLSYGTGPALQDDGTFLTIAWLHG